MAERVLFLTDLGLEQAVVVFSDGTMSRLGGGHTFEGSKIIDAVWKSLPPGSKLYADIGCYWRDEHAVLH